MLDPREPVELACGSDRLRVQLPGALEWERIEAAGPAPARPWREEAAPLLDGALERAAFASAVAGSSRRIVVVVPDATRPAPGKDLAETALDAIEARGASARDVTFLVAAGVHGGGPPKSLESAARARGAQVAVHDSDAAMTHVGVTSGGTAIELSPHYVNADFRIVVGGISFHYFAGFGGGPKMIFPGVASRQSVLGNHRRALGPRPPGGLDAGCRPGRIAGNPVAEEIAEAAALAPPEVALHFTSAGGDRRVHEGADGLAAARSAVLEAGAVGEAGAADCVVASAGGSPLDVDLVQAHKALYHAAAYCRERGTIVFWARVDEGAGSGAMRRWLSVPALDELEERARADYDLNAQTAISLRRLAERHRIVWRGGRCPDWITRTGAVLAASDEAAWRSAEAACRATGSWARGVVLPRASAVVPRSNDS